MKKSFAGQPFGWPIRHDVFRPAGKCLMFLLLPLALSLSFALADDPPPNDLSGIWEAHGSTTDDGNEPVPYTSVVILKKLGDGYVCQWSAGPGANIIGLAVRTEDTFTVSWSGNGHPGLSIFKINEGGKSMSGRWMVLPSTTWESETLRFIAPLPIKKKLARI